MHAEHKAFALEAEMENMQKKVKQLRDMNDARDAKIHGFDQEVSSREDAIVTREASKYDAFLQTARREWQVETERRAQQAIEALLVLRLAVQHKLLLRSRLPHSTKPVPLNSSTLSTSRTTSRSCYCNFRYQCSSTPHPRKARGDRCAPRGR
jgi:uncharacterized protein (DUF3084 family)